MAVPVSAAPTGPVLIEIVTLPVSDTGLPSASWAMTTTGGVMAEPDGVVTGSTVKTSWAAAPPVTLNAALVAGVRLAAVACSV